MATASIALYRLKIKDAFGGVSYFVRYADGTTAYKAADEQRLELSSLIGNRAAETRFALEDALTGKAGAAAMRVGIKDVFRESGHKYSVEILS